MAVQLIYMISVVFIKVIGQKSFFYVLYYSDITSAQSHSHRVMDHLFSNHYHNGCLHCSS